MIRRHENSETAGYAFGRNPPCALATGRIAEALDDVAA